MVTLTVFVLNFLAARNNQKLEFGTLNLFIALYGVNFGRFMPTIEYYGVTQSVAALAVAGELPVSHLCVSDMHFTKSTE